MSTDPNARRKLIGRLVILGFAALLLIYIIPIFMGRPG